MAEDEGVDVRRVDLEERHVVDAGRLRQAVVEQVVAGFASLGRLQVEAEAELALQLLRVSLGPRPRPLRCTSHFTAMSPTGPLFRKMSWALSTSDHTARRSTTGGAPARS
jgi:hypothetical protein